MGRGGKASRKKSTSQVAARSEPLSEEESRSASADVTDTKESPPNGTPKETAKEIPTTPKETPTLKGLSRDGVLEKFSKVPVFVVVNSKEDFVTMKAGDGKSTIFWHLSPATAKDQLVDVCRQNPTAEGLHVGVLSLAVGLAHGSGWTDETESGLRHQLVMNKDREGTQEEIECPCYFCEELQTEEAVPIFLDRADLAIAWERSGNALEGLKHVKISAMDVRFLISEMQKDIFPWERVSVVPSLRALAFVRQMGDHEATSPTPDADAEPPLLETVLEGAEEVD